MIHALEAQGARLGRRIPVHIKVDTGMRRVGIRPGDLSPFLDLIALSAHVEITGVMTHLAAADDVSQDDFTHDQLDRFDEALALIGAHTGMEGVVVHASNTSAAWRIPRARYDMVRVGLGLYGLHPSEDVGEAASGTQTALSMTTRIIHIAWVEKGETVGYARSWRASKRTRVATIAAGYSDGFARFMSNGGAVMIHGERCEVIGRVCMDVSMVDVTSITDRVEVDDEVLLFGRRGEEMLSIEEMARRGGTLSYEILCNVSPRVHRIFERGE